VHKTFLRWCKNTVHQIISLKFVRFYANVINISSKMYLVWSNIMALVQWTLRCAGATEITELGASSSEITKYHFFDKAYVLPTNLSMHLWNRKLKYYLQQEN
jgi:hypothetical protein